MPKVAPASTSVGVSQAEGRAAATPARATTARTRAHGLSGRERLAPAGQGLGDQGQFIGAGRADHVRLSHRGPMGGEMRHRALQQPVGDLGIEAADHDGDARRRSVGHDLS